MIPTIVRTLLCFCLAASAALPLFGQDSHPAFTDKDPTRTNLSKMVHLNLGATTVSAILAALSAQTGLTVKAADYLRERTLIVRMDNLSASSALDALNELNDWTWYRTNPNQILITRRRLRLDVAAASVPRMLHAAIPRDVRTFLNIPTPSEDMSNYVNPLTISGPHIPGGNQQKIYKALAIDKSAMLTSLTPQLLTGEPIPYTKLDAKQRKQLLGSLVYDILWQTDDRLLHTDALPHVADINSAVLALHGATTLFVGSENISPGIKSSAGLGFQVR